MNNLKHTNFHRIQSKLQRGFTIIETLVAIAILMIAIAGPLVVATKGLTAALVSKDQMIASYLAQDTMETIKNAKDNTIANSPDPAQISSTWLNDLGADAAKCNSSTITCDINGININYKTCDSSTYSCPIYYSDTTGYNNSSIGSPTIFKRHYYIETISGTLTEARAHVIVDWNEGTVPYQIELISELVATTR